jgi:hypothetical protein
MDRNEQMSPPPTTPPSLCRSCSYVRHVHGRRGQTYLLCRNHAIAARYPRQPVRSCPGYEPAIPER